MQMKQMSASVAEIARAMNHQSGVGPSTMPQMRWVIQDIERLFRTRGIRGSGSSGVGLGPITSMSDVAISDGRVCDRKIDGDLSPGPCCPGHLHREGPRTRSGKYL